MPSTQLGRRTQSTTRSVHPQSWRIDACARAAQPATPHTAAHACSSDGFREQCPASHRGRPGNVRTVPAWRDPGQAAGAHHSVAPSVLHPSSNCSACSMRSATSRRHALARRQPPSLCAHSDLPGRIHGGLRRVGPSE